MKQAMRTFLFSCLVSVAAPVMGSDAMHKLLEQVQQSLSNQAHQDSVRLLTFEKSSADKKALLEKLKQDLETAQTVQKQLAQSLDASINERIALHEQLQTQSGELTALFTIAKNKGQEFLNSTAASGASSAEPLSSISKVRYQKMFDRLDFSTQAGVPRLQDLQSLWFLLLQDMVANSGIQQYQAPVVSANGAIISQQVTQFGPFAALDASGHYLKLNADKSQLQVFDGLPDAFNDQGARYIERESSLLSIDPQKGKYFELASQVPTLQERIEQGGIVGYVLIALGALGLLVALWRTLFLSWQSMKISKQLKSSIAISSNPLGRVLLAIKGETQLEKAEMLVEKSLLQESAKLERFNSVVKLLAAVAPLLGLLGTVTGMIETFQSITLQGTNDPKLMAGGISQALITTVMGLCVAIPLLFAHSYIAAKSRQVLEQVQQQCLMLLSQNLAFPDRELKSSQHQENIEVSRALQDCELGKCNQYREVGVV